MRLIFQMRREDALAFNRAFHAASPTFQRAERKVRLMLPIIMAAFLVILTFTSGFDWTRTLVFGAAAVLWYFLYPIRYRRHVEKYCEQTMDEGSYHKHFGDYELTFSDEGLHSVGPTGTSNYPWTSVDRVEMTETHLLIFLNGPLGYPIPIEQVGTEGAAEAETFINAHLQPE
ncbi:MAG: YcxB family protein [Verrucomicrobiota bacterium]